MTKYKIRVGVYRNIKRFIATIVAGVGAFSLMAAPAFASAPVVVNDFSPHGWVKVAQENGGTINYVTATNPPLGSGAVEFTTLNDASYTRLRKDVNLQLSDVTNLNYYSEQIAAPDAAKADAAVNLRLYIDTTGGNTFNDVLVYEPYYNGTVTPDTWQQWSIDQNSGYWWSNSGLTYNGHTTVGAGSYATNFHLSDVLATYPNAKVVSIGLGTGDSNAPWDVQADALTVNNTTYDFESDAPSTNTVPTNLNQCKGDGWKNLSDASGSKFRNQGDCVSYVVTNGKNPANLKP